MYLSNENSRRKFLKYFEVNENENLTHPNLSGAAKAVIKGKYIAVTPALEKKKDLKSVT